MPDYPSNRHNERSSRFAEGNEYSRGRSVGNRPSLSDERGSRSRNFESEDRTRRSPRSRSRSRSHFRFRSRSRSRSNGRHGLPRHNGSRRLDGNTSWRRDSDSPVRRRIDRPDNLRNRIRSRSRSNERRRDVQPDAAAHFRREEHSEMQDETAHPRSQQTTDNPKYNRVCRYWLQDFCKFGAKCFYLHAKDVNDSAGRKIDNVKQKDKEKAKEQQPAQKKTPIRPSKVQEGGCQGVHHKDPEKQQEQKQEQLSRKNQTHKKEHKAGKGDLQTSLHHSKEQVMSVDENKAASDGSKLQGQLPVLSRSGLALIKNSAALTPVRSTASDSWPELWSGRMQLSTLDQDHSIGSGPSSAEVVLRILWCGSSTAARQAETVIASANHSTSKLEAVSVASTARIETAVVAGKGSASQILICSLEESRDAKAGLVRVTSREASSLYQELEARAKDGVVMVEWRQPGHPLPTVPRTTQEPRLEAAVVTPHAANRLHQRLLHGWTSPFLAIWSLQSE